MRWSVILFVVLSAVTTSSRYHRTMRAALVFLLLLHGTVSAGPKQKVAILGLEVVSTGAPSQETVRVAQELTVALRTLPRAGKGPYVWAPGSEKELVDEKLMANCASEAAPCMAAVGAALGADMLMYGKVDAKGASGYQVSIKLFDVAKKKMVIGWTDLLATAHAKGTTLQDFAKKGFGRLTDNATDTGTPAKPAPPAPAPPAPRPPTSPANCDNTWIEKGDAAYANGQFALALMNYEASLKCNPTATLFPKAFASSCRSRNATKAKFYYSKLSAAQQSSFAQICMREGIDPK
jgi:hypothetical protein